MGKIDHKPTQNQRILDYMDKYGSITHLEAEEHMGVMRLAARIAELKSMGYIFSSQMVNVKNRYGEKCRVKRYVLESENG